MPDTDSTHYDNEVPDPERLATLLSRLHARAPRWDEDQEWIDADDYIEIALRIAKQGEGQYKTSTITSKLSQDYEGPAPTKLPGYDPHPVEVRSDSVKENGRFKSLPTQWSIDDWVSELWTLCNRLDIDPVEAADLTVDAVVDRTVNEDLLRNRIESHARAAEAEHRQEPQPGRDKDRVGGAGTGQGRVSGEGMDPPNGCDTDQSEDGQKRRSERSDRLNGGGRERCLERHRPERDAFEMRGSGAQRRWLDGRVRMAAERMLFLKLLRYARKGIYQSDDSGEGMDWVGVSAEEMQTKMGAPYHSTYKVWRGSELVEVRLQGEYVSPQQAEKTGQKARTRDFRIPQEVLNEFTGRVEGSRRWWLHTSEPERTHQQVPLSTDLKDENGNYHPDLIDKALRVLDDANHQIDLDAVDKAIDAEAQKSGSKARARLSNLQLARETIARQADGEEGVVTIQNAYTPDDSGGRISFKRGGPQGMMQAAKAKAYDLQGYHNYDIESCHTSALKQLADELARLGVDIDTSPLDEYPGKDKVVTDTGLPRGLVKVVEHSVKNGAFLPASIAQAEVIEDETGHYPSIAEAAEKLSEEPDEALSKLQEVFSDYRGVAIEIAEALLTVYWDEHKQPGGPAGWCMKNHCGVSFYRGEHIEDDDDDSWCHDARTAVMAWALRGLEAAFCHHLTILSADSDAFSVVANEHDGLIIRKEIDDKKTFQDALNTAIETARDRSGFSRAKLVEKAFADEEDVEELYGETQDTQRDDDAGLDPVVKRYLEKREEKARRRESPAGVETRVPPSQPDLGPNHPLVQEHLEGRHKPPEPA